MRKPGKQAVRTFHVFCEVYKQNLFVVLGGEKRDLCRILDRRFAIDTGPLEDNNARGGLSFQLSEWPYNVIWVSGETPGSEVIPTLSHEVFHVVNNTAHDLGIVPRKGDSEATAYLMEFYMRSILKRLAIAKNR